MNSKNVLKLIKDKEIEFVDLRFTDPRGKLQHLTMDKNVVDEVCSEKDKESNLLKLNLLYFVDTYSCLDKLKSIVQYCPKISKFDLWGHDPLRVDRRVWMSTIFGLPNLSNFAVELMVDSILFRSTLR